MSVLKTIHSQHSVLRDSTEEPYAGKPHVGICELIITHKLSRFILWPLVRFV